VKDRAGSKRETARTTNLGSRIEGGIVAKEWERMQAVGKREKKIENGNWKIGREEKANTETLGDAEKRGEGKMSWELVAGSR